MMDGFVITTRKDNGEQVYVPAHYLTHPVLSLPFVTEADKPATETKKTKTNLGADNA